MWIKTKKKNFFFFWGGEGEKKKKSVVQRIAERQFGLGGFSLITNLHTPITRYSV